MTYGMSHASTSSASPRAARRAPRARPPSGPQPGTDVGDTRARCAAIGSTAPPTSRMSSVDRRAAPRAADRESCGRRRRSALLSRPPKRARLAAGENRRARVMARLDLNRLSLTMREAGIGRVLVASLHQGIADILPTRLGLLRELAERRRAARGHDRPRAALRRPQLSAAGGRRLRTDHDARRRVRRGVDRASRCRRCSARSIKAAPVVAARPAAAAAGAAAGAQQLPGQPRDRRRLRRGTAQRRRARVDLLHGARAGAAAAVRLLRGGVHAAAGAVRRPRAAPRSSRAAARASRRACCTVALVERGSRAAAARGAA